MEFDEILKQVNRIFIDIMDNEDIKLTPESTAKDGKIEEWDSLNNIQVTVAVERFFKVRFNNAEMNAWTNVGDMCRAIETRLKG